MLSATPSGDGDTFNFMAVYSLFTFKKSARIVPEIVTEQKSLNLRFGFAIHALLRLKMRAQKVHGVASPSSLPAGSSSCYGQSCALTDKSLPDLVVLQGLILLEQIGAPFW